MRREVLGLCLAGLLLSAHGGAAQATLSVQGNGTVYDSVQNISWDQDANAVKTLCDANDPIWTSFVPGSGRPLSDICASGGDFHWDEAVAWIAHLNANAYKGITNWRLYSTTQPDPTCSAQTSPGAPYPDQGFLYGCTGGELGHMFYKPPPAGLGNTYGSCGSSCFQNTGPFVNTLQDIYWSGTEYAPDTTNAWEFNVGTGSQKAFAKQDVTRYAWAVRAGPFAVDIPVTAIPAVGPGGLGLLASLLAGLGGLRLRRRGRN